eukprot:3498623-Pleurochrysis_carterae.AAC.3
MRSNKPIAVPRFVLAVSVLLRLLPRLLRRRRRNKLSQIGRGVLDSPFREQRRPSHPREPQLAAFDRHRVANAVSSSHRSGAIGHLAAELLAK